MLKRLRLSALLLSSAVHAERSENCVGYSWIDAPKAATHNGPDFVVTGFSTSTGVVQVYVGCCSEVSDDKRAIFVQIDGLNIWRMSNDKGFSGYLATNRKKTDGTVWETQHHFFGNGLTDDARDRVFFRHVRFGRFAAARCEIKQ